jgi:CobQ-like glutamine amidotransferase family enzyme
MTGSGTAVEGVSGIDEPNPSIRVVTLYPEVMDVYADRGNLIALRARAEARGVGLDVHAIDLGDPLPDDADLVLIGGGQDREQRRIAADLASKGLRIREWIEGGTAALAVCGGFQLFGHAYRTGAGEELEGIHVFDVTTVAPGPGWERCIGDMLAESELEGVGEVVGFENHGGRTYLGPDAQPFARVRFGHGNNGDDGTEGAVYRGRSGPTCTARCCRRTRRSRTACCSLRCGIATVRRWRSRRWRTITGRSARTPRRQRSRGQGGGREGRRQPPSGGLTLPRGSPRIQTCHDRAANS